MMLDHKNTGDRAWADEMAWRVLNLSAATPEADSELNCMLCETELWAGRANSLVRQTQAKVRVAYEAAKRAAIDMASSSIRKYLSDHSNDCASLFRVSAIWNERGLRLARLRAGPPRTCGESEECPACAGLLRHAAGVQFGLDNAVGVALASLYKTDWFPPPRSPTDRAINRLASDLLDTAEALSLPISKDEHVERILRAHYPEVALIEAGNGSLIVDIAPDEVNVGAQTALASLTRMTRERRSALARQSDRGEEMGYRDYFRARRYNAAKRWLAGDD